MVKLELNPIISIFKTFLNLKKFLITILIDALYFKGGGEREKLFLLYTILDLNAKAFVVRAVKLAFS